MTRGAAIVAGASSGLGSALCALLAARGFGVVALGREHAVRAVAGEVAGVNVIACDLTLEAEVERAFASAEKAAGPIRAVIYNAHSNELWPFAETSLSAFERAWRVNCLGAFIVAQRAVPALLAHGGGTLIFSGATSSVRGGRRSAAFSSSKFALRGLGQALAREYSAAGLHVAHVVLDGLIWSERTRARFGPEEQNCMAPSAVAAAYLGLIEQERSAWTHELDLRPYLERF